MIWNWFILTFPVSSLSHVFMVSVYKWGNSSSPQAPKVFCNINSMFIKCFEDILKILKDNTLLAKFIILSHWRKPTFFLNKNKWKKHQLGQILKTKQHNVTVSPNSCLVGGVSSYLHNCISVILIWSTLCMCSLKERILLLSSWFSPWQELRGEGFSR